MPKKRSPSGVGVDSSGGPVVDPTENVIALNEASVKRLDDLRASESAHMREVSAIRAEYEAKLSMKESARIDAIRAVDVAANLADRQAAEIRANTLAATVAGSAEAMRIQVNTTAAAATDNLDRRLDPIQKSIEEIRRFQYEAQGQKTQVTEARSSNGQMIAIAALICTLVGGAITAFLIRLFGG